MQSQDFSLQVCLSPFCICTYFYAVFPKLVFIFFLPTALLMNMSSFSSSKYMFSFFISPTDIKDKFS